MYSHLVGCSKPQQLPKPCFLSPSDIKNVFVVICFDKIFFIFSNNLVAYQVAVVLELNEPLLGQSFVGTFCPIRSL